MRVRRFRVQTVFIFALFMMGACVEPYPPPSSLTNADFLVVDGFLNATSTSATVKINHSVSLDSSSPYPPEEGANVSIVTDGGESLPLAEVGKGVYEADNLSIDPSKTYKLNIVTSKGASYSSDYVELRHAAVLDSVVFRGEVTGDNRGTRFYVNSHDPLNETNYYKYLFTETWEYRVTYVSDFKKDGFRPVYRDPSEQVYTCWRSVNSTEILTVSTKRLSTDVVTMFPINFIPRGSRTLSRMYSINVQQRSISQDEFEFWDQIRKTTENLGGLFDPLPSQVVGNVHNDSNPDETVLGYFSAGYVAEKRIFVKFQDLPGALQAVDPYEFVCETKFIPIDQPELVGDLVYISQVGIPPVGYSAAPAICADCRVLGGDNFKPSFWPQ